MRSFSTLLLALSLPFCALAAHHGRARRHNDLAHRARGDLLKRDFTNARLTYYDITVGTTACGGNYPASAFVVALNQDTFGTSYPSPYCGKTIILTANGKTATCQVVDSCPGCPASGGLDLTEGLFEFFAPTSVGVLSGSWYFAGEGDGGDNTPATTSSTPKPKPTPTTTYEEPSSTPTPTPTPTPTHKHTTTSEPPPPPTTSSTTTSSQEPPPTTSKTPITTSTTPTTTHTHHSYTPSHSLSSSWSPSATPGGGLSQPGGDMPSDGSTENLESLYDAIIGLGGLVEACNDE